MLKVIELGVSHVIIHICIYVYNWSVLVGQDDIVWLYMSTHKYKKVELHFEVFSRSPVTCFRGLIPFVQPNVNDIGYIGMCLLIMARKLY